MRRTRIDAPNLVHACKQQVEVCLLSDWAYITKKKQAGIAICKINDSHPALTPKKDFRLRVCRSRFFHTNARKALKERQTDISTVWCLLQSCNVVLVTIDSAFRVSAAAAHQDRSHGTCFPDQMLSPKHHAPTCIDLHLMTNQLNLLSLMASPLNPGCKRRYSTGLR